MIALLLQATDGASGIPWAAIGAGGGSTTISGILLYILRQQGLERTAERTAADARATAERAASEERYTALAVGTQGAYREVGAAYRDVSMALTKLTVMLEQDQRHAHGD